jgi:hypothetical protein
MHSIPAKAGIPALKERIPTYVGMVALSSLSLLHHAHSKKWVATQDDAQINCVIQNFMLLVSYRVSSH